MSRVTEIRYVGYGVQDLDAERAFYTEQWGLEPVPSDDGMAWFKTQGHDEHHVVGLRAADENRVDVIALAADSRADVDALHAKVGEAGCRIVGAPAELTSPGGGYGFRFFSPDGLLFEVPSDVARGTSRALAHWEGVLLKISHIVLHSPDHQAAVQFFTDVLGFKVSDWLGDFMCFLRCNSAHHRIALLPGPPCLNHVAYDMPSVDDMMRGAHRLKQHGTGIGWGPGRHTAGNNTFSYFVTPNGFVAEYTSELEEVDFETHQHKVHVPAPLVMDQWAIGTGGPQTLPHPGPNPGLFTAERMQGHGHPGRKETYAKARGAFDKATALGKINRERVEIPLGEGTMPALYTRAPGEGPKPVVVYCNGLHSCKELLYWSRLPEALARRGVSTLCVDQPGSGEALRLQNLPVDPHSEHWAAKAVDWLEQQPDVDPKRIGMTGISLGGHFAPRAVACEPRFASGACWGANHNRAEVQQKRLKREGENPVPHYWAHVMWAFGARDMDDFFAKAEAMNLNGHMDGVKVPFLVTHGANDRQISVQYAHDCYEQLVNSPKRELKIFTAREGGVEHVGADNMAYGRDYIADWFAETLSGHTA